MRFIQELKVQLGNRTMFFWTGIFPLLLSILFELVLNGAYNSASFLPVQAAVVDSDQAIMFCEVASQVTYQGKPMFALQVVDEGEAQERLAKEAVKGVITFRDDAIHLTVAGNGIAETALSQLTESYQVRQDLVKDALAAGLSVSEISQLLSQQHPITVKATVNRDPAALHFFTLIGMVCMYGGFYGKNTMRILEGNQSARARRILCSGYPKSRLILTHFLVNNLILDTYVTIDILFIRYVLQVDFGIGLGYLLLLAYLGCFAGNGFGLVLGGMFPSLDSDLKDGLLIGISMLFSFLSGMMSIAVKQLVEQHLVWLTYINPCYLLTDGLYTLYYYGLTERFFFDVTRLAVLGILAAGLSIFLLRRRQYDSL